MNFWSAFQLESEYFTLSVLSLLPSVVADVVTCVLRFLLGFQLCFYMAAGIRWPFLVGGYLLSVCTVRIGVLLGSNLLFVVLHSTDAEGASVPRKRGNPLWRV